MSFWLPCIYIVSRVPDSLMVRKESGKKRVWFRLLLSSLALARLSRPRVGNHTTSLAVDNQLTLKGFLGVSKKRNTEFDWTLSLLRESLAPKLVYEI